MKSNETLSDAESGPLPEQCDSTQTNDPNPFTRSILPLVIIDKALSCWNTRGLTIDLGTSLIRPNFNAEANSAP